VLALLLLLIIDCDCDPARPETLRLRQCSLCNEAEKQSPGTKVFFLKDINPRKPNRWLALPRKHGTGAHHLHDLSPQERTELWTAAIAKAKELFGPTDWGVAYNGENVRTQCHTHLHIGRFVKVAEQGKGYIVVSGPAGIPAPPGAGIWIHPVGDKLHVHFGEQITETVLVR
jgi:diadenosine tetraphosphate (Ap4A) HIT family hydrolase